ILSDALLVSQRVVSQIRDWRALTPGGIGVRREEHRKPIEVCRDGCNLTSSGLAGVEEPRRARPMLDVGVLMTMDMDPLRPENLLERANSTLIKSEFVRR